MRPFFLIIHCILKNKYNISIHITYSLYILILKVLGKTATPPSPRHEHNDEKNLSGY